MSERFAAAPRPRTTSPTPSPRSRRSSASGWRWTCGCSPPSFVANAVRHTGVEGGTAAIELRIAPHSVHLSVYDDGPGFTPPDRSIANPGGPGGWGLYLVDQCAARWGAERTDRHRVWLELDRG